MSTSYRFRYDHLLGTTCELGLAGLEEPDAEQVAEIIVDRVRTFEAKFSVFVADSELNRYRATGMTRDADLLTVIALADQWRERSGGAFHPGADAVRELWLEAQARDVRPTADELTDAVAQLDSGLTPAGLNLNAVAKGWIVDRAIDAVMPPGKAPRQAGQPSSVWVGIGGDVAHRGQGSVQIGIENPHRPFDNVAPLAAVEVHDQAIATSGNSRRSFTIDGTAYGHVFDPRTGWPVDHIASASVIAPLAATADVLATIAVVLTPTETVQLVDATPDAASMLVTADGDIIASRDWPGPLPAANA